MSVLEHVGRPGVDERGFLLIQHERLFQVDFPQPCRGFLHDFERALGKMICGQAQKYRHDHDQYGPGDTLGQ